MSVLKTEIRTFCNAKLIREDALADIMDEIQLVLDDLSKMAKWPDLYRANVTADQATLVEDTESSNLPTGCRVLDYIVINDGTNDGRPLKEITFEKWLKRREDGSSSGEPKRFARRGKKVYWDPVSDDDYTAKFYFWRHHPKVDVAKIDDDEDILFGDEFDRVIKYGVCFEVAKTHKMKEGGYIDLWGGNYMVEVAKMKPEEDLVTTLCEYHD